MYLMQYLPALIVTTLTVVYFTYSIHLLNILTGRHTCMYSPLSKHTPPADVRPTAYPGQMHFISPHIQEDIM